MPHTPVSNELVPLVEETSPLNPELIDAISSAALGPMLDAQPVPPALKATQMAEAISRQISGKVRIAGEHASVVGPHIVAVAGWRELARPEVPGSVSPILAGSSEDVARKLRDHQVPPEIVDKLLAA